MQEHDNPERDQDDPSFPQPKRRLVIRPDAHGGDWIKGDRTRLGDDGALYVPDSQSVSGTRRVEVGTAEWWSALDKLDDETRARAYAVARAVAREILDSEEEER